MPDPTTNLTCCTNFAAALESCSKETDNCSPNIDAIVRTLYVAHDWRSVQYDIKDEENRTLSKTKVVSNFNRWTSFIDTISKGKIIKLHITASKIT